MSKVSESKIKKATNCQCGKRIIFMDNAWAHTSTAIKDSGHCLNGQTAKPEVKN